MRICLTSSARRLLFAMVLIWMVVHGGRDARVSAQIGTGGTDEWTTYGGDLASRRYRPFDQINATNFKDLEVAWRFKTDALGARPEFNFEATPLMVGGVVYTTAGTRRAVVALDAATGELLWIHREDEGKRGEAAPRRLSGRGLAYWSDGQASRFLCHAGLPLVALKHGRVSEYAPSAATASLISSSRTISQSTWRVERSACIRPR